MRRGRLLILTSVLLCGSPPLGAQDTGEPRELIALRQRYQLLLAEAEQPARQQFLAALDALERERAAAGDYEGAERVRQRREAAQLSAQGHGGRAAVKLRASETKNQGSGLKADPGGETIHLLRAGAFLEWEPPVECRGWYEVFLTHGVAGPADLTVSAATAVTPRPVPRPKGRERDDSEGAGGLAAFVWKSGLTAGQPQRLEREIVSTGGWQSFRRVSMGRIRIEGTTPRFKLEAVTAHTDGLMRVREIDLVPAGEPPAVAGMEARKQLEQWRETYERNFAERTRATNLAYRRALDAMEADCLRLKDNDTLVRVREEKARLAKSGGLVEDSAARPLVLGVADSLGLMTSSGVRLSPQRDALINLRKDATVTWKLKAASIPSGKYDITLHCRVMLDGGGTAELVAMDGPAAGPALRVEIKPVVTPGAQPVTDSSEPAEPEVRALETGSVVVGRNTSTLVLRTTGLVHAGGALCELRRIELTRTGDAP